MFDTSWHILNLTGQHFVCCNPFLLQVNDAVQQPAAGLVRLALDRCLMRDIRADNTSVIVVMFLDPYQQTCDGLKSPTAHEQSHTSVEAMPSRSRLGTCRFCRSSLLRAALHKLWRVRPAKRLVSHARGILVPRGTRVRLDTTRPKSALLRGEYSIADSLSELTDAAVQPSNGRRMRRRLSYNEACEQHSHYDNSSDGEDETSQSPKRIRCDRADIAMSSTISSLLSVSLPSLSASSVNTSTPIPMHTDDKMTDVSCESSPSL